MPSTASSPTQHYKHQATQRQGPHFISSTLADMASLPAVSISTGGLQRRDSQDSNTSPDRNAHDSGSGPRRLSFL
ncbi:hypothetical protein JMJ78_0013042 [Colletotrichum scovillei]|nr:hypothetical protein JMJ78_0013042 [Colletotrichum scovillei]